MDMLLSSVWMLRNLVLSTVDLHMDMLLSSVWMLRNLVTCCGYLSLLWSICYFTSISVYSIYAIMAIK